MNGKSNMKQHSKKKIICKMAELSVFRLKYGAKWFEAHKNI